MSVTSDTVPTECWEALFRQGTICRLCPDTILRPDEIFSMDESGVTVNISKLNKSHVTSEHSPQSSLDRCACRCCACTCCTTRCSSLAFTGTPAPKDEKCGNWTKNISWKRPSWKQAEEARRTSSEISINKHDWLIDWFIDWFIDWLID